MEPEVDLEKIKIAVNNFLWMNLSADITIGKAEGAAVQIADIIYKLEQELLNPANK